MDFRLPRSSAFDGLARNDNVFMLHAKTRGLVMKKMWGGRFKKNQDKVFWDFQSSISYDKELAGYDIMGSIAHVKMLSKCKIIPQSKAGLIIKGLDRMLKDIKKRSFKLNKKSEDIHSAVYAELKKNIGIAADYMHTARSRNDQVSLDTRMYAKDKAASLIILIAKLQAGLVCFADKNQDIVIPGLTHTQHAVPVLLSHQMLAYVEMFERDKKRLKEAGIMSDEMPLGACAMAGTSFKIDSKYTAKLLKFSRICQNSIDAVSDRDFILDIVYAISIFFMHLSRFCEDIILFSTNEFGILDIPEAFCTGSSIMPQKKNPDALELLRGSSAEAYANLYSLMVMMKGLPLSYNRDMQLDKKALFDSVKKAEDALVITTELVKGIRISKGYAIDKAGRNEALFALDIADYLVKKGIAFKHAHDIVGKLVSLSLEENIGISSMSIDKLKQVSEKFDKDVYSILDEKKSVFAKKSIGSTSPILVKQQIDRWVKELGRS
jgi:argininosuccinate lyase